MIGRFRRRAQAYAARLWAGKGVCTLERGFTQAALVTEDGEALADAGVLIREGQEPAGPGAGSNTTLG